MPIAGEALVRIPRIVNDAGKPVCTWNIHRCPLFDLDNSCRYWRPVEDR